MTFRMSRCLRSKSDDVDEDRDPQQMDQQPGTELLVCGEGAESDRSERRARASVPARSSHNVRRPRGAPAPPPPLRRPLCSAPPRRHVRSRGAPGVPPPRASRTSRARRQASPIPARRAPPATVTPAMTSGGFTPRLPGAARCAPQPRARPCRSRSRSSANPAGGASRAHHSRDGPLSMAAATTSTGRGR